jgi:hypothetical protein
MAQPCESSLKPADSPPGFPRLSIGDLLLLILILGTALAWVSPHIRILRYPPEDQMTGREWEIIAPLLFDYAAFGVTLFGIIVLIRERWRGTRWRLAPGHWYFLAAAAVIFGRLWTEVEFVTIHDRSRTLRFQIAYSAIDAIIWAIAGSMGIWAATAVQHWRWRICFALLAASYFSMALLSAQTTAQKVGIFTNYSLWYNLNVLQVNLEVAFCLAAFIAVAIDLRQHIHRDWLHYVAIAPILLATAVLFDASRTPLDDWWTRLFLRVVG